MSFLILSIILFSCSNEVKDELSKVSSQRYEISSNINEDAEIKGIIKPYKDSLDKTMNVIIGHSTQVMVKGFPEGLLGNFVADLMLETVKNKLNKKVDFAFTNNGGLRAIMPKGDISVRNVYEIMPFNNKVVILKMTPELMEKLFEYFASNDGMAVSGIRFTIKNNKCFDILINGKPYQKDKNYFVLTNDYLAGGGSGMFFLKEVEEKQKIDLLLRDMIIENIVEQTKNANLIKTEIDGRIKKN
ncbi:MAG: 5'-nucleotidase C-terminal domain-containing protein [Bacteroidota bacterium]|nr:5'-nucleotidase C-terminal domain-containing protein [Bacteroidota bacterium]